MENTFDMASLLLVAGFVIALVVIIVGFLNHRDVKKLDEKLTELFDHKESKDAIEERYLNSPEGVKSVVDILAGIPVILEKLVELAPIESAERQETIELLRKVDKYLEEVTDGKPNE